MAVAISLKLITELIYILYARIIAIAVRATVKRPTNRDRPSHPRSMPHVAAIEFPRNRTTTWALRQFFEVIVAGLFPARSPNPQHSAANPVVHGGSDGPMSTGRDRCMAIQRSAPDTRFDANGHCADIPKGPLHGGFAESSEIPRKFQQEEPDKKKIADSGLFRSEKPGKTQDSDVQNSPYCTQKRSKRWQMEPKIARISGMVAR